jgi:hypothetical protein
LFFDFTTETRRKRSLRKKLPLAILFLTLRSVFSVPPW